MCGTPNSANAAARAAAAPLKVGDRIEVWWPLDKNWFAASVRALNEAEGAVEVAYDDGDQETLKLAQVSSMMMHTLAKTLLTWHR